MTLTPEELEKAIAYNDKEEAEGDLTKTHQARMIHFWQEKHLDAGKADAWGGPQTQGSLDDDIEETGFGAPVKVEPLPTDDTQFVDGEWLNFDGPETKQPRSYRQADEYFGKAETSKGSDVLSKRWYKENIVSVKGQLPGVPSKWYVKVHKIIVPYLIEGLRRAQIVAPEYEVKRLGAFNFRHIRNNPDRPLSMHSYGVAFDIDPGRNQGIVFARGKSPTAWSPAYYRYWPRGVPAAWVQALGSCGFTWGNDWDSDGRTDDHRWLDPMHFEWIARDGNQFDV